MDSCLVRRLGAFVPLVLLLFSASSPARAAATATIYATDASGWHNAHPSIDVGGTVTWENRDTNNSHPVECVQRDSNATCPWSDAKDLPPAQSSITGTTPSHASQTFTYSGTFAFRCVVHPSTMTGTIVVGSGKPQSKPTTSSTPTSKARASSTAKASARATAAASASTTAKASARASGKAGASRGATPRTSVQAAGPLEKTGSKGGGVGGAAIPAILLIVLVAGGHLVRARLSARA